MRVNKQFLTPNKFSRPQTPLKTVDKVVIHYVANPMSTAQNNRDYFENAVYHHRYVSAHYVVGLKGEIIQCVPEKEWAYCSNSANSHSISIENCHPKADGKFTADTYNSLVELTADICKRYNLNPLTDIIRHYDVTRKACPLWYVSHPTDWQEFKQDVQDIIKGKTLPKKRVFYRVQVGSFANPKYAQNFLNKVKKDYPNSFIQKVEK